MKIDNYSTAGNLVMQKIEHYNSKPGNKFNPFYVGDGISIDALLNLYEYSHNLFFITSAANYTKTLYSLVKVAILLRPEYSKDITTEEDKKGDREEWGEPVTVKLNAAQVAELFFDIELISDFLNNM